MENKFPRALSISRAEAAQCPACLSFNFLRHLPPSHWRAEESQTILSCATCNQQYLAEFDRQQRAA